VWGTESKQMNVECQADKVVLSELGLRLPPPSGRWGKSTVGGMVGQGEYGKKECPIGRGKRGEG